MVNIFIKKLNGEIENIIINVDSLTVWMIKNEIYKKNYKVQLFRDGDENLLCDNEIISDCEVLCILYCEEEFSCEEKKEAINNILTYIGSLKKFNRINELLIRYNAIIAGGCILAYFGKYPINNIDIYINYDDAADFLRELKRINFRIDNFRDNIIVLCNRNKIINVNILEDSITPEDFVKDFDLSFCQIFYNGVDIICYNIDDLRNKIGEIKNEKYIDRLYKNLDQNLIDRIKKYNNRGYKIIISPNFSRIEYDNEKNEYNIEKIIKDLCFFVYQETRYSDMCIIPYDDQSIDILYFKIFCSKNTMEECIKKWGYNNFRSWVRLFYSSLYFGGDKSIYCIEYFGDYVKEPVLDREYNNFRLIWNSYIKI